MKALVTIICFLSTAFLFSNEPSQLTPEQKRIKEHYDEVFEEALEEATEALDAKDDYNEAHIEFIKEITVAPYNSENISYLLKDLRECHTALRKTLNDGISLQNRMTECPFEKLYHAASTYCLSPLNEPCPFFPESTLVALLKANLFPKEPSFQSFFLPQKGNPRFTNGDNVLAILQKYKKYHDKRMIQLVAFTQKHEKLNASDRKALHNLFESDGEQSDDEQ